MSTEKTPSNGVTKEHQTDSKQKQDVIIAQQTDSKQKQDVIIAQQTVDAIGTEKPPSTQKRKSSASKLVDSISTLFPAPKRRPRNSNRMCRMFFPSSGHMGFDTVKDSDELPPIETLRDMIQYETRLRLSESIQNLMDLYHTDEDNVTLIHDLIQQHVVEYFGYQHVNALRTALHRFPDDPVVKSAFYVKHNKVTQGVINCGQEVRDVELFTIDGHPTSLFSHITTNQPTVLLAGSTS